MRNGEGLSLEQIRAFLKGSDEMEFAARGRQEVYGWVTQTLCEQEYWRQGRESKGLLRLYIGKLTGLSRAQVTRLIARYKQTGSVSEKPYRRNRFKSRYTTADIELLAVVDEAHGTLSRPATQQILYRGLHDYGDVVTSGWRRCRSHTSTTCARAAPTAGARSGRAGVHR